ncbi:CHAD domain-containing protein [Gloeothece verrucosa]|nr:CHAD domain-containing protein [Gloeothece verrucosa]
MTNVLEQQATTFGDWAYIAIAKHFKKILKHEDHVLKDTDPEDLHQMRVGMRRLRSTIAGFAPALALPKAAKEKTVGKIARILGELRDYDVLEDALKNHYQSTLPEKEQKSLDEALKVLAKRRKKAFKEVEETLQSERYLHLKEGFQSWLEKPTYQEIAKIAIHNILPDLLLPQVSKLMLHPGWLVGVKVEAGEIQFSGGLSSSEVETLLTTEGTSLHELRKEAKRSRYNMELFTQFYGDIYQGYLKDIKAVQSLLGDIQDGFVLSAFLGEVFGEDLSKVMPTLADNFRENRYQKWQEWEGLQAKFLNPKSRKDLHIAILQPSLIKSELEATVNS